MKKILVSFMGLLLSFGLAPASAAIPDGQIVQIALISEPIDVFANGQRQTLILIPQESSAEVPSFFGVFTKTFQVIIDPNECETRNKATRCSEVGAQTYLAKLHNRHELILLAPPTNSNDSATEIQLMSQQGQPLRFALEVSQKANDPGRPKQVVSLVVSDSKRSRRAQLTPFLKF
jgi:hypothetical protein